MSVLESELAPSSVEGKTARFTWRELLGPYATEDRWTGGLRAADADRTALPWGCERLRRQVATDLTVGGVLLWNRTTDEEGGDLIMLTGQECWHERQVVKNAGWMVSCGTVYAADRVGWHGYKQYPDYTFDAHGEQHFAWLIPNDRNIEGLRD